MKKIRLLLIEDNRILRDGIETMLKQQSDISTSTSTSTSKNVLLSISKTKPNIVLLDLSLRDKNSLELVKLIRKQNEEIKIIVMDLVPLQSDVFEYVQAGVSGFILKDANAAQFVKTIRSVCDGLKVLPTHLTGSLFSQIVENALNGARPAEIGRSVRMTRREREVIELIAEGCTNKEIAQRLNLSTYTIKSHVHNILEKLSLSTRVQIAKHAHQLEAQKTLTAESSLSQK